MSFITTLAAMILDLNRKSFRKQRSFRKISQFVADSLVPSVSYKNKNFPMALKRFKNFP